MASGHLDPARDGEQVFADTTRRAICRACRQKPRTIHGLKSTLGRPDGPLRSSVKTLHSWGVLSKAPHSSSKRAVWAFNPSWSEALNEASRWHATGKLFGGVDVILVPLAALSQAAPVLARTSTVRPSWGAQFADSQLGLMVVFDQEADPLDSRRLHGELRGAGAECVLVHVQQVLDEGQLRDYCRGLAGGSPELPE